MESLEEHSFLGHYHFALAQIVGGSRLEVKNGKIAKKLPMKKLRKNIRKQSLVPELLPVKFSVFILLKISINVHTGGRICVLLAIVI